MMHRSNADGNERDAIDDGDDDDGDDDGVGVATLTTTNLMLMMMVMLMMLMLMMALAHSGGSCDGCIGRWGETRSYQDLRTN